MAGHKIGALAARAGTSAATIRYYEQIALMRRADRQDGNQRRYADEDLRRLTFIRRCRDIGLSIDQVRSLVALVQDRARSCLEARDLAQAHLDDIRRKLRELRALERSVADFVRTCSAECAGGPGPDCSVLDRLADADAVVVDGRALRRRAPNQPRGVCK